MKRKPREVVVSVRLSEAERARICAIAEQQGKDMSAFMREASIAATEVLYPLAPMPQTEANGVVTHLSVWAGGSR